MFNANHLQLHGTQTTTNPPSWSTARLPLKSSLDCIVCRTRVLCSFIDSMAIYCGDVIKLQ